MKKMGGLSVQPRGADGGAATAGSGRDGRKPRGCSNGSDATTPSPAGLGRPKTRSNDSLSWEPHWIIFSLQHVG